METWEEQIQAPDIQAKLHYINNTPEVQSILYDLDLLPEQTMKYPRLFLRTITFVSLHQRITELERKLGLCREVQAACIEDDAEGPHYLGVDLYKRFTSTNLD